MQLTGAILSLAFSFSAVAAGTEPSAKELAASLADRQEGTAYVRLRLTVKGAGDTEKMTLQLQIKERRTKTSADVVYQVLWPKERKGEAVLLHQAEGRPPSGSLFSPPDKLQPLNAAQMSEPLFGSGLSYLDVIEDFFTWENQAIAGNEVLNGVNCIILESKPAKADSSAYSKVRSWIDTKRMVPLRVEKYLPSGELGRRIETTRVATDDKGRPIPADLVVSGPRDQSLTNLDGSKIRHDVTFADQEFTPEGLKQVSVPPSSSE